MLVNVYCFHLLLCQGELKLLNLHDTGSSFYFIGVVCFTVIPYCLVSGGVFLLHLESMKSPADSFGSPLIKGFPWIADQIVQIDYLSLAYQISGF